jgi:hypothetical protein
MTKETAGPAFPCGRDVTLDQFAPSSGMTLRQYAAIKLKVADSGTAFLDVMITKSLRDDFVAKAMQAMCEEVQRYNQYEGVAKDAYKMADAMLEARK